MCVYYYLIDQVLGGFIFYCRINGVDNGYKCLYLIWGYFYIFVFVVFFILLCCYIFNLFQDRQINKYIDFMKDEISLYRYKVK